MIPFLSSVYATDHSAPQPAVHDHVQHLPLLQSHDARLAAGEQAEQERQKRKEDEQRHHSVQLPLVELGVPNARDRLMLAEVLGGGARDGPGETAS